MATVSIRRWQPNTNLVRFLSGGWYNGGGARSNVQGRRGESVAEGWSLFQTRVRRNFQAGQKIESGDWVAQMAKGKRRPNKPPQAE